MMAFPPLPQWAIFYRPSGAAHRTMPVVTNTLTDSSSLGGPQTVAHSGKLWEAPPW